jgi:hypothetical protein
LRPISGSHQGQRPHRRHRDGGNPSSENRPNTCLHPNASRIRQIPLAPRAPSIHGPTVWTGRALQAKSDGLEKVGLALLYPALERNMFVPGHHGYPHASDLILGQALKGQSGHQITDATARPFSISSFQLADLGGKANPHCVGISLSRPLGATVARSPNPASEGGDRGRRPSPW